jgi:two-component system phosphate regulon response regulator PhoB
MVMAEQVGTNLVQAIREARHGRETWQLIAVVGLCDDTELDAVLSAGADECLTLGPQALHFWARLKARLRHTDRDPLRLAGIVVDPVGHRVTVYGQTVDLGILEFRFLSLLARQPGRAFSFDEVQQFLYGTRDAVSRDALKQLAARVRRKLGEAGYRIEAVRGIGFRLT